jgi:predicted RNA-binding protein
MSFENTPDFQQSPTLLLTKEEFVKECDLKLEMLSISKESIESTSDFISKKSLKYSDELLPKLASLWYTRFKESSNKRKVPFIYLGYEILRKCRSIEQIDKRQILSKEFKLLIQKALVKAYDVVTPNDKEKLRGMVNIWR